MSNTDTTNNDITVDQINDTDYTVDTTYTKGDVRRYGVYPNRSIQTKYLNNIIELASLGMEIHFPQGLYQTNLVIKGQQGISMNFDDAAFTGQIQIIQSDDGTPSKNIALKGKLTTYSKFFIRFSENVNLDTLIVATDTLKNMDGKRSLGCSIYSGTKHLKIKKLVVQDLGSGEVYYNYALAALQIHGWNNNPRDVTIDEVIIESSDRHGAYITGSNHRIKDMLIKKVGLGTLDHIHGLDDAEQSEIYDVTALWINKCQNSMFEKVHIDCHDSNAKYTINFDEGNAGEPTIIDYLTIKKNKSDIKMNPNDLTNIVVRHFSDLDD